LTLERDLTDKSIVDIPSSDQPPSVPEIPPRKSLINKNRRKTSAGLLQPEKEKFAYFLYWRALYNFRVFCTMFLNQPKHYQIFD